jgi:hypothetical protein
MKSTSKKVTSGKKPKRAQKDTAPIPKSTLNEQREIAKAGMISSLGTLVFTGFFRFKGAWKLHTWAGWALLGFSIWHHTLSAQKSNALSEDE